MKHQNRPSPPRRRTTRRKLWGWLFAVAIVAIALVVWPVDSYGEGALWDVKRAADSNIRAPIAKALEGAPGSNDANTDGQLRVIPTATPNLASWATTAKAVRDAGIEVNDAPTSAEAFYGLIAECGGADYIRDTLVESFIGPRVERFRDEYRQTANRNGYTDVNIKLVKGAYGYELAVSGENPAWLAEATGVKGTKEAIPIVLHLRERVEWLPPSTPEPVATPTPALGLIPMPRGWSPGDPTPTPLPTPTPKPTATPAKGETIIAWRIETDHALLSEQLAAGEISSDCETQ